MLRTVFFGEKAINYELERKKVKNINLRIKRDLTVTVSASRAVPSGYVDGFVLSRAEFILKTLEKFKASPHPAEKTPESGESYNVFGKPKRLAVIYGDKDNAEFFGDVIILTVTENTLEKKQKLLDGLFGRELLKTTEQLCRKFFPFYESRGVTFPTIKVRRMRSRWGSCIPQKHTVTFSLSLISEPVKCVEYVVAHELTHFIHPDHSKRFYDCLAEVMPDWKERKRALDGK